MKWSVSCIAIVLLVSSLIGTSHEAITITAARHVAHSAHTKLKSIDESIVYRALTVIEGDILVDKFCECQPERFCRSQRRTIIVLTQ